MTVTNERYVLTCWVQQELNRGRTAYQISLIQNSGGIREVKGVNKYGVAYDSKSYATSVLARIK